MSETTPRLTLPLVAANQAQKHVPINEALTKLDALVQLSVISRDLAEPPSEAEAGDRYIVAVDAAGAWIGQENKIASHDSGWVFTSPAEGWLAWDQGAQELVVFTDGEWATVTVSMEGETSLQNIPLLGVGAEADETNPFSAKLNSALWTASVSGEGGSGDLRCVMNKEAAPNVLSLLMQSDYSGRAEIGLIGDDDLLFKVSADGSTWKESLRIDNSSGRVSFPAGGPRELLTGSRTYYVRSDGSDSNDGRSDASGGAFLTLQKAVDIAASLDLGIHDVTINIGPGTYDRFQPKTLVGAGAVRIVGDVSTPSNVVISSSSGAAVGSATPYAGTYYLSGVRLVTTGSGNHALHVVGVAAVFDYAALDFGSCGATHVQVETGAFVNISGSYTISGGAQRHWHAGGGIIFRGSPATLTLSGTPNFSTCFARASLMGVLTVSGTAFSGPATGKRYDVVQNALINTGGSGASFFPGDVTGTDATSGVYA